MAKALPNFGKRVTGLLPIRKLADGEEVIVKVFRVKQAKLGELFHVRDLETGDSYALSGHAALLNMLEEGKAYRIVCKGDAKNPNTGRTYRDYEVFEEGASEEGEAK